MVPGAGIEPARPFRRGILSPLRLPISPPGLGGLLRLQRARRARREGHPLPEQSNLGEVR